ncbi:MAG: metallophosphoesterase [Bacillota bacterium]
MNVFAIGDLHLAGSMDKTMDIFGSHWEGHWKKIKSDWLQRVGETDVVLLPGDTSWAMRLGDAVADLMEIAALPGTKVIIKGNHDFWWSSVTKLHSVLPPNMLPLQNQAYFLGGHVICGTRGWPCPSDGAFSEEDKKIYEREVSRLELSLRAGAKLLEENSGARLLAMMHFPPFNERQEESGFVRLFKEYGVRKVVYGHLHGKSLATAFEGELDGVEYTLVSCDHLGFKLKKIC